MSEHKEVLNVGVKKLTAKKPKRESREILESNVGSDKTWTWKTYKGPPERVSYYGNTGSEKTEIQLMLIKQNRIMRGQMFLTLTLFINTLSVLLLCYLIKSL